MYGVINKSLRDMVIEQFGEGKWQEVLLRSGVPDDSFLAMQSYDDDITYSLAQACADEMDIDLSDALRAFGVHWVENTVARQYESLLRAAGSDMLGFLGNLNNLHDRISSTFLNYRPPNFRVREGDGKDVEILYLSERVGLTPFVEGLLQGLAQRFNQPMEIMGIEPQSVETGEKTLFKVRMG
ncbi:heme NO-binding domain-containing protein [Luminiphilus sp.]|nr:heme NO-binding domain-containing protein [Luminiphilus sp.]